MLRLATFSIRAVTLAVMLFTSASGTLQPAAHLCLATGLRMSRPCCPEGTASPSSSVAHIERACCVSVSAAPREALLSLDRQKAADNTRATAVCAIASFAPPKLPLFADFAPRRAAGPPPAQRWRRLSPILIV